MLGLLSTGAVAGQSSKWQEPTSFLGVKLGESLALPSCRSASKDELCKTSTSKDRRTFFLVDHTPDLGFEYKLFVDTESDVSSMIILDTKRSNFETLKTLLSERYGPPRSDKNGTVQNRMGATFSNEVLAWTGPNYLIRLEQRGRSLDRSNLYVFDKAKMDAEEARTQADTKSKASAL